MYEPVGISPGTSSFDIDPNDHLDPNLFDGLRMRADVRYELLSIISGFISERYQGSNEWLRVWMAGSGASFRWHSFEGLRDLDMLLGIDFVAFRAANGGFVRVGDAEIAQHLNEEMRTDLWPQTADWHGLYEVTWYVNQRSSDIRSINPYAAYDLIKDEWAVPPSSAAPQVNPAWEQQAESHLLRARAAVNRYSQALTEVQAAQNPAHRADAERRFRLAVDQAVALFDTVHGGRRAAFSPTGGGYGDFANYLWQSGKKAGWVPALRRIKDYHRAAIASHQQETYGLELPDASTLIRRAMIGGGG